MEPLFTHLVVGVVPLPTQNPPFAFDKEALQSVYLEVSRAVPYTQFAFLPADQGAQLLNPPEDRVLLQPGLLQVGTPVDSTAERAREKASTVLVKSAEILDLTGFLQMGIKVLANVPAPEDGAREFVGNRLMKGISTHLDVLGGGFFGGGVKFRKFDGDANEEEILLIEPLVSDDHFIWVNYDRQQVGQTIGLDHLSDSIDEAFNFVRGPAMRILEEA